MMMSGFKIKLLWLVAMVLAPAVWAAGFSASLDRDTMTLGETATLTLTFEGGSPGNTTVPDVPGLDITSSGTSQSYSLINGAMSSTVAQTYTVTASRPGKYTIPAISADVGGQTITSDPLNLSVMPADAPSTSDMNSGNEIAFMTLSLPPGRLYAGEQVIAELRLFIRDDVQNFGNFQFTAQNVDGFLLGKNSQGGRSRARVGDRVYTMIPITYALTATRTGTATLGPFSATAVAVVPAQDQPGGGDPFFRQFFNQGEQKQISLATEPVNADVLPLPDANKPANFNGAIGQFKMAVTVGPTNVTVGDPITLHVQFSGHGSLDSISLPDQSGVTGFKLFPPTAKTDIGNPLGLDGSKTFEEIVTPQNAGVREWPEFSFFFFNPEDGQYHTVTQPAIPLSVRPSLSTPLPALTASSGQPNQAPNDILPIKETLGTLTNPSVPLLAQPLFVILQVLPLFAFLAAFVWRRQTDALANNPRLRRQRAVAELVRQGMNDLQQAAAANQSDQFFAILFRLLQEQLGERLDCPASAITENIIDAHPLLQSAPSSTRNALRDLFQLCNQARYAPVRGSSELKSVADQCGKTMLDLQALSV